jgi:hypothetical protein
VTWLRDTLKAKVNELQILEGYSACVCGRLQDDGAKETTSTSRPLEMSFGSLSL